MTSSLIRLESQGIGTPEIEGSTSYLARMAYVHCVPVRTLFDEAIYNEIGHYDKRNAFRNFAKVVNGINSSTKALVDYLSRKTELAQLSFLTLLNFEGIISPYRLIRKWHAYCPFCYEGQRSSGMSAYDQLAWSIQSVSYCPKHSYPLETACPFCKSQFPRLTHFYQPGYCPRCYQWLGREKKTKNSTELPNHEFEMYCSKTICELLAGNDGKSTPRSSKSLTETMGFLVAQLTNGSNHRFGRLAFLRNVTVNRLVTDPAPRSLSVLVRVCYCCGIDLTQLLLGDVIDYHTLKPRQELELV